MTFTSSTSLWARTAAIGLLLLPVHCQMTDGGGTEPATAGATFCQVSDRLGGPLPWSSKDRYEIQVFATEYNLSGKTLCGWTPPKRVTSGVTSK